MFINLSNHPVSSWSEKQRDAAAHWGKIADLPFPAIDPAATADSILLLAEQYETKIRKLHANETTGAFAVHVMGELTFCFALVVRLQKTGILCLASTTRRKTIDNGNGSKTVQFDFVSFREYPDINNI